MNTIQIDKELLKKLKKKIEPWGAMQDLCEKSKVHRTTIRRLVLSGWADESTIEKIKPFL